MLPEQTAVLRLVLTRPPWEQSLELLLYGSTGWLCACNWKPALPSNNRTWYQGTSMRPDWFLQTGNRKNPFTSLVLDTCHHFFWIYQYPSCCTMTEWVGASVEGMMLSADFYSDTDIPRADWDGILSLANSWPCPPSSNSDLCSKGFQSFTPIYSSKFILWKKWPWSSFWCCKLPVLIWMASNMHCISSHVVHNELLSAQTNACSRKLFRSKTRASTTQ